MTRGNSRPWQSHSPLRHTYASLCVAAGIPQLASGFMGHAMVTTTLSIYTHLFDDDHAERWQRWKR